MMRNRGTAAVLAMIFLAVFAVLGVSFFTMATTSSSTARNDRDGQTAAAAADSGVALLQRLITDVVVTDANGTGDKAMNAILDKLQKALHGTSTMRSATGAALTIARVGNQILIPAQAGEAIPLHENSTQRFSAVISFIDESKASELYTPMHLAVTGYDTSSANVGRAVAMDLICRDRTLEIFSYGVFSKGRVDLADGKASILGNPPKAGSIGSAYTGATAIYLHGGEISGEVIVSGDPSKLFSTQENAGKIAGIDITDAESLARALEHVREAEPPLINDFNPNQFNAPGLKVIDAQSDLKDMGGNTFADLCIQPPAGQDKVTIRFQGGDALEGTIYVKPGVTLDFGGGAVVRGVIVVEDPNIGADGKRIEGSNKTSTSSLRFTGTPIFEQPVWPADTVVPEPDRTKLQDYSVLGPTAYVYIQGEGLGKEDSTAPDDLGEEDSTAPDDKHTGFARTVVCGTLEENGSGIVNILDGTLVTMSDTMVTGTKGFSSYISGDGVRITRSKDYKPPYGGYIHQFSWAVDPRTYQEVTK